MSEAESETMIRNDHADNLERRGYERIDVWRSFDVGAEIERAGLRRPCRVVVRRFLDRGARGHHAYIGAPASGYHVISLSAYLPANGVREIVRHEIAHARQSEAMPDFPAQYAIEMLRNGYNGNRYEIEARDYARR